MNDLGIKGSLINDSATQGPNGRDGASALAGLANSFQELVGKAGFRIEDGISSLIDNTAISSVVERPEPADHADDYGRDNADTGRDNSDDRDRFDNEARNNDTGEDHYGDQRAEKDDGYGRENGAEHRDDQNDNHTQDDGAEHGDDSHAQEEGDGNEDTSTDQQASDDAGQEGDGNDHSSAETGSENQSTGDENSVQGDTAQTTLVTNEVLTSLVAGGEAVGSDGKASQQGKTNSADGIAKATSNIAGTGTEKAAAQGTESRSQTAAENISKTTPTSSSQNKGDNAGQGQANASDQAKNVANEQSAIVAGTDDGEEALSNVNAQAAGLAKAIGDGNRAQVTVTVNNESQNLTSKPGQTLSTNTVLSAESGAQQANSQNTNANTQGNNQNPAAQGQLPQNPQAQNQGTQAAQAGASAKGLAQASSVSSGSATTTHAGGGEGTTQLGSSTAAQQTQSQSAAKQTESTQKTFRPGHSVVDQISVKITKAIQSGQDKITIQLRPANMGRVEVKMEVSHDSRLTALVTVDNRETLDQLRNDSRSLQRALQDAGLQTDAGDLQFNMRGQEGQGQEAKGSPDRLSFGDDDLAILETEIIDQPTIADDGTIISNGRVDVRA